MKTRFHVRQDVALLPRPKQDCAKECPVVEFIPDQPKDPPLAMRSCQRLAADWE
jgi:hypothetical protein